MNDLRVQRFSGKEILPYLPDLAKLRITIFHDYPYLYEGNLEYEKKYLQTYAQCPDSVLVIAFDGDNVVGASSALPLKYETDDIKKPFIDASMDVNHIFYFGESVLMHAYRGKQIGKQFFIERENAAREQGYSIAAFCGVDRPADHPKRPPDWHPLNQFWQKLGYQQHPNLTVWMNWKEIDEPNESRKALTFWLKKL